MFHSFYICFYFTLFIYFTMVDLHILLGIKDLDF